jgi:hypothetical protein
MAVTWAAVAVLASACGQAETLTVAAAVDATQAVADTSAQPDVAAEGPQVKAVPHAPGPYVEIAAKWDGAARRLRVTVWVGDVKNFLGIAGHLRYDPAVLELTASESWPLAENDPAQPGAWLTRSVLKDSPAGRVLAGAARTRVVTHPWMAPDGVDFSRDKWFDLEFKVRAAGTTELRFDPDSTLCRQGDGAELALQWLPTSVTIPAALVEVAP